MHGKPTTRRTAIGAIVLPLSLAPWFPSVAAVQAAPTRGLRVQRLAWAGIRLQAGSTVLFIDARAPDLDGGAPGPELEGAGGRTFALATHGHGDHCDLSALQKVFADRDYLVVHEDTARQIDARRVQVQAAKTFEPIFLSRQTGEFVAWAVPAADGLGSPQVSWVVDHGGKRIIHCGDTSWHGHWWAVGRAFGPFDAAFLPVNGFRQSGGMFETVPEPMGLTPEQAVRAAKILAARQMIPIHFGGSGNPNYVEEKDLVERLRREAAREAVRLRLMVPGEELRL